jgi:hypothetical protein
MKIENIRLYILRWSIINRIISGIIGKSMFFISMAVPVAKLLDIGIDLTHVGQYRATLAGSTILAFCYILNKIFTPELISIHENADVYANNVIERYDHDYLDVIGEYSYLNEYETRNIPVELSQYLSPIREYLPVILGVTTFSKTAVYVFANAKFNIDNMSKIYIRGFITILLLFGLSLFYYPIIISLFKIFCAGL